MMILDVREKEEFEAEHIPESVSLPLTQLDLMAPGILKTIGDQKVIVMCRSGNRARMAMNELKKFNADLSKFEVYEGGILKWKEEGKPVRGKGSIFPIMRQVQIVASSMIFLAFILSKFLAPEFVYLALFVGCGLAVAGWTGFCPMVFILQRMPWNKKQIENCTPNKTGCCG